MDIILTLVFGAVVMNAVFSYFSLSEAKEFKRKFENLEEYIRDMSRANDMYDDVLPPTSFQNSEGTIIAGSLEELLEKLREKQKPSINPNELKSLHEFFTQFDADDDEDDDEED